MNTFLTIFAIISLASMAFGAPTHAPDARPAPTHASFTHAPDAQFAPPHSSFMQPGPIIRPFPGNDQVIAMLLEIIKQLLAKLEQSQNHSTMVPATTTMEPAVTTTQEVQGPSSEAPFTTNDYDEDFTTPFF